MADRKKEARIAGLGIASNAFGWLAGAGLAATPEPTMLTKVAGVSMLTKSSYGMIVNVKNLVNALNDKEPYSTGGLGTDLAVAIAPGNNTAKALGTVSELSLDLLTGGAGRLATSSSLGPLNKYAIERVFVRNPTEFGSFTSGVQWLDLGKTYMETSHDLK